MATRWLASGCEFITFTRSDSKSYNNQTGRDATNYYNQSTTEITNSRYGQQAEQKGAESERAITNEANRTGTNKQTGRKENEMRAEQSHRTSNRWRVATHSAGVRPMSWSRMTGRDGTGRDGTESVLWFIRRPLISTPVSSHWMIGTNKHGSDPPYVPGS